MASNDSVDVNVGVIFENYPEGLHQFAYALCIIFTIIGIPANLITIIALATCTKFRNATAILIINLHISNLIFCCMILPITAATFSAKHWIFGDTMCSVYPLMKYSLNCVAHFTVVAITINRYIIVCHPQMYPRLYKTKYLITSLICIWILGFVLFLPTFFGVWGRYDWDQSRGDCTMIKDKNEFCPKIYFLGLAFGGPYVILLICYSRIWWTVRQAAKKRGRHNVTSVQPAISNSASDSSDIENGQIDGESLAYEGNTDDDTNNNPTVLTPDAQNKTIKFFRNTFNVTKNPDKPTRKDKKLATMIVVIIVSFTICHLPIMISRAVLGEHKTVPLENVLVHLLEYASAFLSPILYVIISSEYRQVYGSLFASIKSTIMKCFKS